MVLSGAAVREFWRKLHFAASGRWPDHPFEHQWSFGIVLPWTAFGIEFGGKWKTSPWIWIYLGLWWVEIYYDGEDLYAEDYDHIGIVTKEDVE